MIHETEPRRALTAMGITLFACFVAMMAFGMGKITGTLDPLVARRGFGAMLGLMLVATGNFVPKLRLFQPATSAAQSDAIDRFAGWTFVICGFAFAAVFLFAPANTVFIVPPLIVMAGFLTVLARWLMWKGKQPSRLSPDLTLGRRALATALVSVLWVSSFFLADAIWDDASSRWIVMSVIAWISFRAILTLRRSPAA